MQEKILSVPYISQNDQSLEADWHLRACGITCVGMILNFHRENLNLMDLINEGLLIGGYGENAWTHESLVRILRNHSIHAYAEEFRTVSVNLKNKTFQENSNQKIFIENGIKKITQEIKSENPVIVSVKSGFGGNNYNHLILVTGFKKINENLLGFYIHDPDFRTEKGTKNRFVEISDFKEFWRNFAIFSRTS